MSADLCQCPMCGRMHKNLGFGKPPASSERTVHLIHEGKLVEVKTCNPSAAPTAPIFALDSSAIKVARELRRWGIGLPEEFLAATLEKWAAERPRFICLARRSTSSDPQDCGWPWCGCDPQADKVLAAIQESGGVILCAETARALLEFAAAAVPTPPWEERIAAAVREVRVQLDLEVETSREQADSNAVPTRSNAAELTHCEINAELPQHDALARHGSSGEPR
jgi:hypothetical protein